MNECTGWAGRLLGHHFRPIYDESWTDPAWIAAAVTRGYAQLQATSYTQDHRRTVRAVICLRCGRVAPFAAPVSPDEAPAPASRPQPRAQ